jgi:hypothetical protein
MAASPAEIRGHEAWRRRTCQREIFEIDRLYAFCFRYQLAMTDSL